MSILWADFPSGQRGLYGTNLAYTLNGVWGAQEGTFFGDFSALVADPDPTIGANGVVLRFNQNGASGSWGLIGMRFSSPGAAQATAGMAFRLWLNSYPIGDDTRGNPQWEFRTIGNALIARFKIGASGQIRAYRADGTFVGESPAGAITANGYNHIESKIVRDAAAGTIEVRVNGATRLNLNALALGATDVTNYFIGQDFEDTQVNARTCYYKDVVFWDGAGAYANNFQGSVAVYDLFPDADVSLNWTPSIGATGYPLIADTHPAGTLTAGGAIVDGETCRIDNTYYRFTNAGALDAGAPAGTAGNPWRTLIGGSVQATLLNLYKAIGATGVAGVDYSTALVAHPTANANGATATKVSITAKAPTAGLTLAETGANLSWDAGVTIGGPTDPSYIEAGSPAPLPAVFTMTNLPPDVTSVRALMPIFRAQKTDGGDCNVQAGLSPDNVAWVNGADQPLTVAFTYWWTPIHTNPVSAAPWTPGEVNNAYVRVNRTL